MKRYRLSLEEVYGPADDEQVEILASYELKHWLAAPDALIQSIVKVIRQNSKPRAKAVR